MNVGGVKQILTTRHEVHTLLVIVERHREMVAARRIFARQHDITQKFGLGIDPAGTADWLRAYQGEGYDSAMGRVMFRINK